MMFLPLLRRSFAEKLIYRVCEREADQTIGDPHQPYLYRWWLIPRNRWFNIYLHHFCRSDDDRALHDHPWWNLSWLIEGEYDEVVPVKCLGPALSAESNLHGVVRRRPGAVVLRRAKSAHRVALVRDSLGYEKACWTLFLTGPRVRDWGFWCPNGWRHWHEFTDPEDSGKVGPGCD